MALRACQFPGLLIRVPSMQLQGFVAVTAAMRQAQVRQVGGWLRNGTLPDSLQTTCRLQQLAWAAVERMMMGLGLFAGDQFCRGRRLCGAASSEMHYPKQGCDSTYDKLSF